MAIVVMVLAMTMRMIRRVSRANVRDRIVAKVSRLWRWEFWPMWLFYLPVAAWASVLSMRHRGFTTVTAANPAIPHGGFVGESKAQILARLDPAVVLPFMLIEPASANERASRLLDEMARREWNWPIILKPDVGQRGAGVRLAHNEHEARDYLAHIPLPVIAQIYHPGPHEAGIFYYRLPGEERGRIYSITDKIFPELVGDGISTLEQQIWSHPRYRMQARTFLTRHASDRMRVLAAGERFRLAIAGNHCQGTCFRDGAHLITPQLEAAIDRIARSIDGFHFGRFDVRYSDVEAFRSGSDLHLVELNGITSESTNLYDPTFSLFRAYRIAFGQWSVLFRIGAANRARGIRPSRMCDLVRDVVRYYRQPHAPVLSD